MAQIISVHSFRGGTGKSNTTANLSALLAMHGKRVGIVDTDIQSPGIHVLFGLGGDDIIHSLNDYLWGKCAIEQAALDVTSSVDPSITGRLFLVPSNIKAGEIARILREGYDVGLLNDGFQALVEKLDLDVLMIDTHPGLNEETLLSVAISDALVIIMRPDQQDYQGTSVTVEVARKLGVPRMMLIVNKIPEVYDMNDVREQVEAAYDCEVAALLPHSDEMMALGSAKVFVALYPDHPITTRLREVMQKLVA